MSKNKSMPLTRFNIDFIGHRWAGFALTVIFIAATAYSLATKGLNFGIDFTGGIVIEIRTETPAKLDELRKLLNKREFGDVSLQAFTDPKDVMIRLQSTSEDEQQKLVEAIKLKLDNGYSEKIEYRKTDYVGAVVGQELITGSLIAIGLSMLSIMAYLWLRFEWQYGMGGIISLIHDALLTIGFFAVTQLEFNLTSVAALLTVVGYSINDSVVIYDRIRENFRKYKALSIADIINLSVNETLSRTFMTGFTVILTAGALALFGGEVMFGFSSAMLFGVVIGTFSSVYISAMVLIYLKLKR